MESTALAPVSLLALYPSDKRHEVSHHIIFCDNSTLSIPLRHVSDPSSLLRRAFAEDEDRTGFFWKQKNGTLLVIFSASKLTGERPSCLESLTAKDAPLIVRAALGLALSTPRTDSDVLVIGHSSYGGAFFIRLGAARGIRIPRSASCAWPSYDMLKPEPRCHGLARGVARRAIDYMSIPDKTRDEKPISGTGHVLCN